MSNGKIYLFMGHQDYSDTASEVTAAAVATANATSGGMMTLRITKQPYLKICTFTGKTCLWSCLHLFAPTTTTLLGLDCSFQSSFLLCAVSNIIRTVWMISHPINPYTWNVVTHGCESWLRMVDRWLVDYLWKSSQVVSVFIIIKSISFSIMRSQSSAGLVKHCMYTTTLFCAFADRHDVWV